MSRITKIMLAGLLSALGGCATLLDPAEQLVEVRTIAANQEVFGAGCVLSNDAGRWFVVAPGRVTITRSSGPLAIDCAREGQPNSVDVVESRFDTARLMGNVVVTGGLGYLVDHHSGAGFAYPATLTVILAPAPATEVAHAGGNLDNRVF